MRRSLVPRILVPGNGPGVQKLGKMNRKKQNGGRDCRGGIGDRPFAAAAQPATHKWRPSIRTNN